MARNKGEPIKDPPPEPETSEEEEEKEEEEGSSEDSASQESDAETEQTQTQTPAKPKQPPPPQPKEPFSSSGEEESGSETESEPDDAPTSKARPLASKPVVEKQKANDGASNARSKSNAPDPVTPTKSAAAKRSAGDASSKDAKKLKKADEAETSEKKANIFQRLWSEQDEIAVLEGMIEYTSKKKADPVSELSAFHDFIKQKLQIDATRTQLQDKIRRLKKKYENNKSKEKEGEEKTFSKPHELKSYELSKRIWGNQNIKENGGAKVVGSPKANGRVAKKTDSKKVNVAETEREEANDVKNAMVVNEENSPAAKRLKSNSVGASVEERMLVAGPELVEEEEWEKLKEVELELYLKQLEVKVAQTKLVLDAMKGRGH